MWNKTAQPFIDKGDLVVIGMIQEQHPERCRLYAQWKQLKWPIVYDQMNVLGIAAVPVPLFIDEYGVIRNTSPRPKDLATFVSKKFEKPVGLKQPAVVTAKAFSNDPTQENSIDQTIERYSEQLAENSDNAIAEFRLGVALRAKFDSAAGKPEHFEQAAQHWSAALRANPNQYIWRRRIEQYGPRLAKPYPFYDWVEQARKEIKQRGEQPIELQVALAGAEIAKPSRKFVTEKRVTENPDPDNRIVLDDEFVSLRVAAVPNYISPNKTTRVHIVMSPENCKWNNESEPVKIWINGLTGGTATKKAFVIPNPTPDTKSETESKELRSAEFEFKADKDATECQIDGYALYNVCESETGTCRLLRQNFSLNLPVLTKSKK